MTTVRRLLLAGLLAVVLMQEPPIGPAPCNSDTLWGCYPERVYLPVIGL